MAVYVIIDISICHQAAKAEYAQYVEKVRPIVEKHGGRYLARGGQITPVIGDWRPERIILIEFPSADHVRRWWNSPEYKAIAGLREQSTQPGQSSWKDARQKHPLVALWNESPRE